jgi:large subunit ribosomal protein L24
MPTKAEVKQLSKKPKLKIRKGDQVMIISGKDKGQIGTIATVLPKEQKVVVVQDNPEDANAPLPLNAVVKHQKAQHAGAKSARIKMAAPLHISKVMLVDPKLGVPTRVGRKVEGEKIVRYAKKSGTTLADQSNVEKNS